MNIVYDIPKIKKTLSHICNMSGMSLAFWSNKKELVVAELSGYNPFCNAMHQTTESACSNMETSEDCPVEKVRVTHIGHAGLPDSALPLYYNNIPIGFLAFCQISGQSEFSDEKIQSVIEVATSCIQFIVAKNNMLVPRGSLTGRVTGWIEENLSSDISYKTICDNLCISQSTLYYLFNKHYGCTVHEYINNRRLERAAELLRSSAKSVGEIALQTGFSSQNYFSRLFKEKYGTSPAKYRKKQ